MTKLQKGARVLVTGGTGFVGGHVVESLMRRGANVVATYLSEDVNSYFSRQGLGKQVSKVHVDIRDHEEILRIVSRFGIEFIVHLAAQPIVDAAFADPFHTLDTNIMGTVSILEAARQTKGIRGVLVASSDKAYGKHGRTKYLEKDRLVGDHPYEVSKSAADLICNTYVKTYGLPVVVTRFGNIYGEGDTNFSRIIPGMMDCIIKKKIFNVRSDGTFVRDYLYVKDVAKGYLSLLDNFDTVKGETFNFGSKETVDVVKLIGIVRKTLKVKFPYKLLNTAVNEITYQSLDYTKIHKATGWAPHGSFKTTLPGIYRWYKKVITT